MTDQRLVDAFEELARQLPDPPDRSVEQVHRQASRRSLWRRVAITAAAGLLLVVGVVGVAVLAASRSGPPVVDEGPPGEARPPAVDSPVTMLLSPQPASPEAGPLALIVVNRSDQDFSYAVGGTIERWQEGHWRPFGRFTSALTFWHGTGRVVTGDEPVDINDILLSAPPRAAGPTEWISLPALKAGWYRFSKNDIDDSRVAVALLEVSQDATGPQLTAPGQGPLLDISQPAARKSGGHELRFVLTAPGQSGAGDLAELRESMSATAVLEMWKDSEWVAVTDLDVDTDRPEPRGNVYEWAVQLPELETGAYRLVQHSTSAGPVVGHFWITDLLASPRQADSSGQPGDPGTHRGPVPLEDLTAWLVAPDVLDVEVPSCNGNPVVEQLQQDENQVLVQVTSTVSNPGDGCLDAIRVELDQPLGERELVDITSGTRIQVQEPPNG